LTAKAYDDQGESSISQAVQIEVTATTSNNPNQKPIVSLVSPSSTQEYFLNTETINIQAQATDPDGEIAKVEFYQDGTLLGQDADGSDGYQYLWSNLTVGEYELTAKAYDDQGESSISQAVEVKVISIDDLLPLPSDNQE